MQKIINPTSMGYKHFLDNKIDLETLKAVFGNDHISLEDRVLKIKEYQIEKREALLIEKADLPNENSFIKAGDVIYLSDINNNIHILRKGS